ncbi:HesA/MoeB/ThiF family protein [Magnetococcus sp. PR-3]|uniref:HesA/MoeB/ThiF family protein n=1 Tax=Magnetococcus sp. PR-3 TaxID=3120355 RepID=UPI002FCE5F3C
MPAEYKIPLLLGAGGLGSATALALGVLGVKRFMVADDDRVDLSNLQRQVIYDMADVGRLKVEALAAQMARRFPGSEVIPLPQRVEPEQMGELFAQHTLVVDGSDNFETRFAANDAALQAGVSLVHGAITGWRGQVMSVTPGLSPCLRCLFEAPPQEAGPTCRNAGVLGSGVGEIGAIMAEEVFKLQQGSSDPLHGALLTVDLRRGVRRSVYFKTRLACLCQQGHIEVC